MTPTMHQAADLVERAYINSFSRRFWESVSPYTSEACAQAPLSNPTCQFGGDLAEGATLFRTARPPRGRFLTAWILIDATGRNQPVRATYSDGLPEGKRQRMHIWVY